MLYQKGTLTPRAARRLKLANQRAEPRLDEAVSAEHEAERRPQQRREIEAKPAITKHQERATEQRRVAAS